MKIKKKFLMYAFFVLTVTSFLTVPSVVSDSALWHDSEYLYRSVYEIDSSLVDEELTDFPVLVYLNSSYINWSRVNNDLSDICFVDSFQTTLSYEIENYTQNDEAWLWVKLPTISNTSDTKFFMYYGDVDAVSAENSTDVWSNGYCGVWHMGDNNTQNQEIEPLVIYEDDETFWSVYNGGSGSYEVSIAEEVSEVYSGDSSLNVTVGVGVYSSLQATHNFGVDTDWSNYQRVCFWYYGQGSNAWMFFYVKTVDTTWSNYRQWGFRDTTTGWTFVDCSFSESEYIGGTPDYSKVRMIGFVMPLSYNTWCFDRLFVDEGVKCLDSTTSANDGLKVAYNEPEKISSGLGEAQQFDGVDDYLSVSDSMSLSVTSSVTISMIVNASSLPTYSCFVIKEGSYKVRFDSGKIYPTFICSGGNAYKLADNALSSGVVYHVVITYETGSGNKPKIYVNGSEVSGSVSGSTTGSIVDTANDLGVGIRLSDNGVPYDGTIDEVRILNSSMLSSWVEVDYLSQTNSLIAFVEFEAIYDLDFQPVVVTEGFVLAVSLLFGTIVIAFLLLFSRK